MAKLKPYTFGKRRAAAKPAAPAALLKDDAAEREAAAVPADLGSGFEVRVYKMLLRVGWKPDDIETQQGILGGRSLPGGQVIDFVLYTPASVGISCKGRHWHGNEGEETILDVQAAQHYAKFVVIWDDEVETDDQLEAIVRERIGQP